MLCDEGEDYARRLEQAGVPVTLLRCNGMVQGFLTMIGMIRRAETYFDQVIQAIVKMAGA